jgi:hypothetical protein
MFSSVFSAISGIASVISGLITFFTGLISLIILVRKHRRLLVAAGVTTRDLLHDRRVRWTIGITGLGLILSVAGLAIIGFENYERERRQQELAKLSVWLDRNVPYFAVIEYANDKVLGIGSEKLDYIHISDCTMQFQRTFHPNITAVAAPRTLSADGTSYSERFDINLAYSSPAWHDSTDFGGVKYPDVRIRPSEGNVIWHNEYRNVKSGAVFNQTDGASPNYDVRLHFPDEHAAKDVFDRVSRAITICRALAP